MDLPLGCCPTSVINDRSTVASSIIPTPFVAQAVVCTHRTRTVMAASHHSLNHLYAIFIIASHGAISAVVHEAVASFEDVARVSIHLVRLDVFDGVQGLIAVVAGPSLVLIDLRAVVQGSTVVSIAVAVPAAVAIGNVFLAIVDLPAVVSISVDAGDLSSVRVDLLAVVPISAPAVFVGDAFLVVVVCADVAACELFCF
jgi:hypothetical protein